MISEKSFAAEWKVFLDMDEIIIWKDMKKIIIKEPIGI